MVRQAAVEGQFYMADEEQLKKQVESCFYSKRGPGDLPVTRSNKPVFGVLVPHAGYPYSGPCAAWAYKEIAESKMPEAFVILGPNHYGRSSGMSIEDWKTPLGMVKSHKDIIRELKDKTQLSISEEAHVTEHSLEVQVPFLQYISKDKPEDLRIVPIVLGTDMEFESLGKELAEALKDKKVTFIISSDLTHYGPNYGYLPFTTDIPERLSKLDNDALKLIKEYDVEGFKNYINKTGITICGFMPILVFLSIIKYLEDKPKASLLMHYMSGDLMGDYKNSVSYASMLFKR